MVNKVKSVSGSVKTRSFNELDPDRYEFLSLDQAEPNPGLPESDGSLFTSDVDGTRKFTTKPDLSGLQFKSLPQNTNPQYVLTLNGDPNITGYDSVRWSFFPTLDNDTLFTVTQSSRGTGYDSTPTAITVGALTTRLSANIGTDLIVEGNLFVNGTETILNTEVLTVEDRNIVIAQGALNSNQWDSSGIIVYGSGAEMLYHSAPDRWDFNRGIGVTGASQFDNQVSIAGDLFENANLIFNTGGSQEIRKLVGDLTVLNDNLVIAETSANNPLATFTPSLTTIHTKLDVLDSSQFDGGEFNNKVYLTDVPLKVTNTKVLFRRQTDGLVMEGDVDVAALADIDKIDVKPTDSDAIFYPLISFANGGVESRDSAEFDLDLTYQPSSNTLTVVNSTVTGLTNLDSTFVEGDFRLSPDETGNNGRLLDDAGRSFVIYDSVGELLWGNNGVSAENLGGPPLGGPLAAQLYLNDIVDVQLNSLVIGQVIKWDGVNWVNAPDQTGGGSGGLALTDLAAVVQSPPSGTGNLSYDPNIGVFYYRPPFVPINIKQLDDVDTTMSPAPDQVLKWDGVLSQWTAKDDVSSSGGSGDPNQNAYSFITDGSNTEAASSTTDQITFSGTGGIGITVGATNQVVIDGSGVGGTGTAISVTDETTELTTGVTSFTFTGAGVTASNVGNDVTVNVSGSGGALPTRDTTNVQIVQIANNTTTGDPGNAHVFLDAYSSYALLQVESTHPCWLRMYTDTTSRDNDNRSIEQDPTPDAGVIAEAIFSSNNQAIKMSPGVIGWLTSGTSVPLKITNLSGGNANITITFTFLQLEA